MPYVALVFTRIGNGCWESKIPELGTCISLRMKEGANAIDLHYYFNAKVEAEIGSRLLVVLDTSKTSEHDTILVVEPALSGLSGLSLLDTVICEELLLHGLSDLDSWILKREIYAKFLPLNKGLEAFVKRTGMKGLLDK